MKGCDCMSTNTYKKLTKVNDFSVQIFEDQKTHEYVVELYLEDEKIVLTGKTAVEYLDMTCTYIDGLQK